MLSEEHMEAGMTICDVLTFIIHSGPGRTEAQLSEAVFGKQERQQRVNLDCVLLVARGVVERKGTGGPADPFRYFPKEKRNT
jgi:hypothetical protein